MRSLILLALTALAALPLSAHEHGRGRVLVVEAPRPLYRCATRESWEQREYRARERREDWGHQAWHRGYGCEEGRVLLRPGLHVPPFGLGLDIRIR